MPERAEVAPVRRALALLEALTDARRPLSDDELVKRVGGYRDNGGESAKRLLRHDKQALRARGLVEPDKAGGTKRSPVSEKPENLHLSLEERRAVHQARAQQRSGKLQIGPVQPPQPDTTRYGHDVDRGLRLLRLVEESDGPVPVAIVASSLNVTHHVARSTMRNLADAMDSQVELQYLRDADDIDTQDITSIQFVHTGQSTLAGGTQFLGLFAYSRDEITERLTLIDAYQASPDADPATARALESVRCKLNQWSVRLSAAPPPAMPPTSVS